LFYCAGRFKSAPRDIFNGGFEMTYTELKNFALQLINRYSIAGSVTPPTYNNQNDYTNRIPALLRDAQNYIATTVKKIPAMVALDDLQYTEINGTRIYELPRDLWKLMPPGLWMYTKTGAVRYGGFKRMGNRTIALPATHPAGMTVEYYRYPKNLGAQPRGSDELDNDSETHAAAAYYVAAHLIMDEDPFMYSTLYNEFEAKLGRLVEPVTTEVYTTDDVYFPPDWSWF
jgi:hypothetical protein